MKTTIYFTENKNSYQVIELETKKVLATIEKKFKSLGGKMERMSWKKAKQKFYVNFPDDKYYVVLEPVAMVAPGTVEVDGDTIETDSGLVHEMDNIEKDSMVTITAEDLRRHDQQLHNASLEEEFKDEITNNNNNDTTMETPFVATAVASKKSKWNKVQDVLGTGLAWTTTALLVLPEVTLQATEDISRTAKEAVVNLEGNIYYGLKCNHNSKLDRDLSKAEIIDGLHNRNRKIVNAPVNATINVVTAPVRAAKAINKAVKSRNVEQQIASA